MANYEFVFVHYVVTESMIGRLTLETVHSWNSKQNSLNDRSEKACKKLARK